MSKWSKILTGKEKDICPQCKKAAIVENIYRNPGSSMGRKIDGLLEKHGMNQKVEYKCESCGFTY